MCSSDLKPVPPSFIAGEQASPTQPFSGIPSLVSQKPVDPEDAWGVTFWDRGKCRDLISDHRNEGIFTPPDTRGTILSPGYIGGVNWGGMVFDEQRQRVIAAVNHLPMMVTLIPPTELQAQMRSGEYPNSEFGKQVGTPYGMRREPLLSPWGLPCTAPPWGTLVSVDLRRNRIAWQVPLGVTDGLPRAKMNTGRLNHGGPIATASVNVNHTMDIASLEPEQRDQLRQVLLAIKAKAEPNDC